MEENSESRYLQDDIRMLNDLCADTNTFSYSRLAAFRFPNFTLDVNPIQHELTIVISTEEAHGILLDQLHSTQRLAQLLSIHFKKVHIAFGVQGEPASNAIILDTVLLKFQQGVTEIRDTVHLGARLRRALNIALRGHVGVLKFKNDKEAKQLRLLLKRDRIKQLMARYDLMPFDDDSGKIVKFWKPRHLEEGEKIIIIVD